MSGISTHILDVALGRPAVGVPVRLEQECDGAWKMLTSAETDKDGRVRDFLPSSHHLIGGSYRITFITQSYFESGKVSGLYPEIQVTFLVRDPDHNYHIPLLLAANGYSTYRGS